MLHLIPRLLWLMNQLLTMLQICKELIVALSYKLRMFGVEIDGPANIFCDNHGVVKNVSILELTLMKKHNAINYHAVREVVAAGVLIVGKEDGETNLVDLLTKVVMGQKRWDFCCLLFILLSWSNSQVILVVHCHGITSHTGRKRLEAL